jgi:Acyltransferase
MTKGCQTTNQPTNRTTGRQRKKFLWHPTMKFNTTPSRTTKTTTAPPPRSAAVVVAAVAVAWMTLAAGWSTAPTTITLVAAAAFSSARSVVGRSSKQQRHHQRRQWQQHRTESSSALSVSATPPPFFMEDTATTTAEDVSTASVAAAAATSRDYRIALEESNPIIRIGPKGDKQQKIVNMFGLWCATVSIVTGVTWMGAMMAVDAMILAASSSKNDNEATASLDPNREVFDRTGKVWARTWLTLTHSFPEISGDVRRLKAGGGPCLFVSNHASWLDIPVLCTVLDPVFKFIAKGELRNVPCIGHQLVGVSVRLFLFACFLNFVLFAVAGCWRRGRLKDALFFAKNAEELQYASFFFPSFCQSSYRKSIVFFDRRAVVPPPGSAHSDRSGRSPLAAENGQGRDRVAEAGGADHGLPGGAAVQGRPPHGIQKGDLLHGGQGGGPHRPHHDLQHPRRHANVLVLPRPTGGREAPRPRWAAHLARGPDGGGTGGPGPEGIPGPPSTMSAPPAGRTVTERNRDRTANHHVQLASYYTYSAMTLSPASYDYEAGYFKCFNFFSRVFHSIVC